MELELAKRVWERVAEDGAPARVAGRVSTPLPAPCTAPRSACAFKTPGVTCPYPPPTTPLLPVQRLHVRIPVRCYGLVLWGTVLPYGAEGGVWGPWHVRVQCRKGVGTLLPSTGPGVVMLRVTLGSPLL